ncbi:MAG: site-specific integrase [Bacteroidetes bacterium]|nr:site-specific integrase [Bacteroidota bacterium]
MERRHTISFLFYVKRTKAKKSGQVPLYVRITVDSIRTDLSLGRTIDPDIWGSSQGRAIGRTKEAQSINDHIRVIQGRLHNVVKHLQEDNEKITPISIKKKFLGVEDTRHTIISIFQEHNEKVAKLVKIDYSPETLMRYQTSLRHTQEYIRHQYGCDDLPMSRLDHRFVTNYEMFLKVERNCSHNTTMKYLKNFKKIIRIAMINGWLKKDPFSNYKMTLKKVDRGFLTEDELQSIIRKDFRIDRLNRIRDCFVFSCFTGLAYIDLKHLAPENITVGADGRKWINTARQKTSNKCNVPLLPIAEQILDKYENDPALKMQNRVMPVLSNQKQNAYLQEIADLCGITKHLTTHLARHTFATTVTLNNDVPIETVSKMLGHSDVKMTRIYARLLDKKVGQDMSKLYEKY